VPLIAQEPLELLDQIAAGRQVWWRLLVWNG
jgi:hypothetical protein